MFTMKITLLLLVVSTLSSCVITKQQLDENGEVTGYTKTYVRLPVSVHVDAHVDSGYRSSYYRPGYYRPRYGTTYYGYSGIGGVVIPPRKTEVVHKYYNTTTVIEKPHHHHRREMKRPERPMPNNHSHDALRKRFERERGH